MNRFSYLKNPHSSTPKKDNLFRYTSRCPPLDSIKELYDTKSDFVYSKKKLETWNWTSKRMRREEKNQKTNRNICGWHALWNVIHTSLYGTCTATFSLQININTATFFSPLLARSSVEFPNFLDKFLLYECFFFHNRLGVFLIMSDNFIFLET